MNATQDTILNCLRQNLATFKVQYHIKTIGLFGSFATETATPISDVDLVIEFDQPIGLRFVDLCDDLEACLGRKVDVLTIAGVENIHNRVVRNRILESLIYV